MAFNKDVIFIDNETKLNAENMNNFMEGINESLDNSETAIKTSANLEAITKDVKNILGYDSIDNYTIAFDESGKILWANSDTMLGGGSFYTNCPTATKVVLNKNLTDISGAFSNHDNVVDIYIYPDNENALISAFASGSTGVREDEENVYIRKLNRNYLALTDLQTAVGFPNFDGNIGFEKLDSELQTKLNSLLDLLKYEPINPIEKTNDMTQPVGVDENGQLWIAPIGGTGGGLTSTATSLLISILQNAVYTSDQSAVITALETALKESGTSGGTVTPDTPQDPDKTYYSVLATGTNCTIESSATSIVEGGVYVGQITPNDGYTIETVTVTMDGKDVTNKVYSDGSISITNVTGDIVIVATSIETPNDLVYSTNWTYGKRQCSPTAVQDNDAFTSSDWVDVTAGQELEITALEETEIDGVVYKWNTENLNVSLIFRNTTGGAVSKPEGFSNYMGLNDNYPTSQKITIPNDAVSMCLCVASGRSFINSSGFFSGFRCETIDGRPVWFSFILKDGGEA